MNWRKATLLAVIVTLLVVTACSGPAVPETQAPTTAPPTTVPDTEVPPPTVTAIPPADTAAPPTDAPPTTAPTTGPTTAPATTAPTQASAQVTTQAANAERVSFRAGATSAVVTGDLGARETDSYVLRILEGQLIEVSVEPQNAVQLVIYGADGTVLRSGMGEGSFFRGVVPSTQDYIIQLTAGEQAVSYTMNILIPQRVSFETGSTAAVVTGDLGSRETDSYVLRVLADQLVEVSVEPQQGVQLVVYGADGTVLRSGMGEGAFFRGVVPSTQDYIFSVSAGEQAVSYTMNVLIPERITFARGATSAEVSARLGATDSHHFVIRAQAGQTMRIDVTPDAGVQTSIYGVDGSVLKSGMGGGPDFETELTISQDYIIHVRSADQPVNFTMEVEIE